MQKIKGMSFVCAVVLTSFCALSAKKRDVYRSTPTQTITSEQQQQLAPQEAVEKTVPEASENKDERTDLISMEEFAREIAGNVVEKASGDDAKFSREEVEQNITAYLQETTKFLGVEVTEREAKDIDLATVAPKSVEIIEQETGQKMVMHMSFSGDEKARFFNVSIADPLQEEQKALREGDTDVAPSGTPLV